MSWELPQAALKFLERRIDRRAVVVELGSGDGTPELADLCGRLYSVEHNPDWIGKHPLSTNYIDAPIVDGWYDVDALTKSLPEHYDALVIDGPPGNIGRGGFLTHIDMFRDVPMLFDDIQRRPEYDLAVGVATARKKNISMHYGVDGRAFATVGWPA
jgi:hypothetical protein